MTSKRVDITQPAVREKSRKVRVLKQTCFEDILAEKGYISS